MSLTEDVAGFITGFNLGAGSDGLVDRAKEAFLDSLGVMLAGACEESSRLIGGWVRKQAAPGESTVFAEGNLRTSAANAALANGVAAHTLDFDHSGHQSAVIVPCVLAVAESLGASGRNLLEAYIVGVEVSILLAQALGPEAKALQLHPSSICGSLGAAATACRLLGLKQNEVQVSLGIAASLASGLSQNFGTMVKPLHLGSAARNGILAAELSAAGFTANPEILDQKGVFFSELAPSAAAEHLGKIYEFLEPGISFKAYPCPYSSQRAVDAAIRLADRHDVKAADVEEIICVAAQNTFRVLIHHRPTTSLEAKFCLEYLLAAGITTRTIREEIFELDEVRDPVKQDLVERVRIVERPVPRIHGEGDVTVQVRTRSGLLYEETVSHAPGHPKNPLSFERLAAKYRDCCRQGGLSETASAHSLEIVTRLEQVERVDGIIAALRL
jgi:2-methylcitrate dehydratase PrpD